MNLVKYIKRISPFNNVILNSCIRGAKKKSDKKSDQLLSEHILNPYKSLDDRVILPDDQYPQWIYDLIEQPLGVEDVVYMSIKGEKVIKNNF